MRLLLMIAATASFFYVPRAALSEQIPLEDISRYLNDLRTAVSRFTQINDDGSISSGTVYIKRPGRVRFEYDPPETGLVIAGSNTVVIYDAKSNQPAETYPLRRTPLSVILARRVDLAQADMVIGHEFDGEATIVIAQDPENPEYGNIALRFGAEPIALQGWRINTANGSQIDVLLNELTQDVRLENQLFDVGEVRQDIDR
ncbi:MAG: outer membrane lipoprotein carrier protein LolA [Pseudomonadota bacterium]